MNNIPDAANYSLGKVLPDLTEHTLKQFQAFVKATYPQPLSIDSYLELLVSLKLEQMQRYPYGYLKKKVFPKYKKNKNRRK